MSRRLHEAAMAFTMDGTILVSVAHLSGPRSPDELIRKALDQRGDFFIGVAMDEHETKTPCGAWTTPRPKPWPASLAGGRGALVRAVARRGRGRQGY